MLKYILIGVGAVIIIFTVLMVIAMCKASSAADAHSARLVAQSKYEETRDE